MLLRMQFLRDGGHLPQQDEKGRKRRKYMKKTGRIAKTVSVLLMGTMVITPLASCSKTMDPENIPKPPVASTDEDGEKISPNSTFNWLGNADATEPATDAARTFRDYDMGLFVGAPDLITAYYSFDDPRNYYSDWPTVGLFFPGEDSYQTAVDAYTTYEQELSSLDPSQLSDAQLRAIKDMCFDFRYSAEAYKHYNYFPQLNPMGGKQMVYPLLTSLIQFESKDDVLRYFVILGDYYTFFTSVFEAEKKRSEMGIGWNDENIDRIIEDCRKMQEDRDTNFMKTTFESRVGALQLPDQETAELIKRNQELLDTVYYPAMEMLIERLPELKGKCNDAPYLAETSEGKAYYEALFHQKTGVELSVEECIDLLQKEIDRIYEEYYPIWKTKGTYFSFGDLDFDEATQWCQRFTQEHYPQISSNELDVYEIPEKFADSIQPARYYSAPIDNYTKHTVWVNSAMVESPQYDMYTLVSHEMYPGHLYQHQYQAENLESKYQVFATSLPYAEGWAQYSERNMLQYAPFDHDQAESSWIASLLYSTYISARLSIGVEYEGWDYERCKSYIKKYGQDESVIDEYWSRITAEQCFAVEYAFGYLFTSEILDQAVEELSGICTQEEVIKAYLDLGCAPFEVLKEDMAAFVESKKS